MASTMMRMGRHTVPSAIRGWAQRRAMATATLHTERLPDLDYDYGALEPHISGDIMKLHHQKHHQTYVTNFNKALEQLESSNDPEAVVALQSAINFNGGGHINHSIFWKNLAPTSEGGGSPPQGNLAKAIDAQFGGLDKLTAKMNAAGAGVQGSGWVWLGYNKELKRLVVETTQNQDPLQSKGLIPLLGIDVWEHAYYLQYKNVRPDYLKNIWKVVNWKDVAKRYESA
ncbi:hypothetical protein M758_11G124200 [Ceratodon purpureus]|uniref:Superoxide dismutase n=1 Tax=Ceratodon purpureus TaxID=3225 RepID=A0A8T0GFU6_CERPU|nr:hypothetical protein KC19_11G128400 [Ceratodon purpureus]KAG0601588.1 hypothetical protein M758_11G124200 [Ceratodon purpureus]